MTQTPARTFAYAFDLRQLRTGAVLGVGLVAPSRRYLSFLTVGDAAAVTPDLSPETWRDLDAWEADGNARLPRRPAPMSPQIVEALMGADAASTVSPERFAAIPLAAASRPELVSLAAKTLPELLRARQSTA